MITSRFASLKFWRVVSAAGLLLHTFSRIVSAQVLYDAGLGTLPAAQGWAYAALPGSAVQTLSGGAAQLNTLSSTSEHAGYSRIAPAALNRANGFAIQFTARVQTEMHSSADRAGFSVIVLSDDRRGIELGFWTNTVFAQTDSPLFTHGEDASFDSATDFVNYAIAFLGTNYVLWADGSPILSGPVRDYTTFSGFIDPYETPDFLFFGDDTSSAQGAFSLKQVTLVTAPHLELVGTNQVHWLGVAGQTYTVQTSTNLVQWSTFTKLTSATSNFYFTNRAPSSTTFVRVAWP